MKSFYTILLILFLNGLIFAQKTLPTDHHASPDVTNEWRLAMQLWTFHKYTFFEALDKTASLGVSWVEAFPGQALGKEYPDVKFDQHMDEKYRKVVKDRLRELGLTLVNYGVVGLPNDEAECRTVFDFAKDMGIETIASEPPDEAWDLVSKLCDEYKINVAVHNHPEPSYFWNPDKVLEFAKGRSKYIGSCADIGHWMRSGIEPIDALQKLKGRIKSFHFGDLNTFGDKEAHDVPWGSGVADLKGVFKEMKDQGFKGVFSIEYEYNWEASVPDIRESIKFFNQAVAEIKPVEWKSLLDDSISQWQFEDGSWKFDEGVLSANGGGDIWSKEKYSNFILNLDFKLEPETNSGVFIRTGSIEEWLHTAIEVQILDSYDSKEITRQDCGGIFDCLAPAKNMVNKPGEWNRYTITCKDNMIYVVLNGTQVVNMNLDKWTEAHKNPDGTQNKFNTAYKDMPRDGYLGLQYHGHPIYFRNIKIKEL